MKRKAQAKRKIAECLDLPAEVVCGCPKMIIIGDTRVIIENHEGIFEITKNELRINTQNGILAIYGGELEIKELNADCAVIDGKIHGCKYENSL